MEQSRRPEVGFPIYRTASDCLHQRVVGAMFGSIREVCPLQVQSKATGELFTIARSLTDGTGISDFSLIHEELLPGRRTSSPHSHTRKDELYLVLSGTPSVYVNEAKRTLRSGDYIIFKSG